MLLWIIVILLLLGWGAGFALRLGGGLIHLLLVLALIVLLYRLVTGKKVQ